MFYFNFTFLSCQSHDATHEKKEHTKRETSAKVVDNSKETFTEILPPHCDEKTSSSGSASVNFWVDFESFQPILAHILELCVPFSCIVFQIRLITITYSTHELYWGHWPPFKLCYIKLLGNITQAKLLPFVSNPEVTWTSWPSPLSSPLIWSRHEQTKGHKSTDSLLLNEGSHILLVFTSLFLIPDSRGEQLRTINYPKNSTDLQETVYLALSLL